MHNHYFTHSIIQTFNRSIAHTACMVITALSVLSSTSLSAQVLNAEPLNTKVLNSQQPISPQNMVAQMGTGVDATWSEVKSKIADYTPQATQAFANKGFKHVRLRLAQDPASATWGYLDQQIQDALDNGMIPIIANQSHTFEDTPNAQTQAEWVKWWGDMAAHYKDYPYELMFDLIVEIAASSPLSDEPINQLNQAYEQAVNAIRAAGGNNDKRIIIFSAHKRSDPTKLHLLDTPSKGNGYLIGEFHEGYASGPSTDPENPHYYWSGGAAEILLMTERRDAAITWSTDTGIPLWEGAWMPGNYNKGDDYDVTRQIAFVTDFIGVLNEYSIPHAVNATKKFYDVTTNTWTDLEPVVDAIIALAPQIESGSADEGNESHDPEPETAPIPAPEPETSPETTPENTPENPEQPTRAETSGGQFSFGLLLLLMVIGIGRMGDHGRTKE